MAALFDASNAVPGVPSPVYARPSSKNTSFVIFERQRDSFIIARTHMHHDKTEGRQSTVFISPMLAVEDAGKAAEWYERALGAVELWNLGSVIGLQIEGAPFFLHEATRTGFISPLTSGSTTVRIEVFVDDPDAFIRRAIESGADGSVDRIRDHQAPWGPHRQGGFRDPFGHVWLVGDKSPLEPFPRVRP